MTINLLPEKLKSQRKASLVVSEIHFDLSLIFIALITASLGLALVNLSQTKKLESLDNKIIAEEKTFESHRELEKDIIGINSRLKKIAEIDNNKIDWSNFISSIANSTPPEVTIDSLSLTSLKNTVSLTGKAATRKDIAVLKEKLEASEYFNNVIFNTSSYNSSDKSYSFSLTTEVENNE